MTEIEPYQRDTVENVYARVSNKDGLTLDSPMTVFIAVTAVGGTHTWLAAAWVGTAAASRSIVTTTPVNFSAANYPNSEYVVYTKVVSGSQSVIDRAGTLRIAAVA